MLTLFGFSCSCLLVKKDQLDKAIVVALCLDASGLINFVPVVFKVELGARMQVHLGQCGHL